MTPVWQRKLISLLAFVVALDLVIGVVALYARSGTASASAPTGRASHALNRSPGAGSNGVLAGAQFSHRRGSESRSSGQAGVPGGSDPAATSTAPPTTQGTAASAPSTATTSRPTTSTTAAPAPSSTRPSPAPTHPGPDGGNGTAPGSTASTGAASPGATNPTGAKGDVVIDDPAGDAVVDGTNKSLAEGRADIVRSQAAYRGGYLVLTVQVREPVDPKEDSGWKSDATFLLWELDTNGDGTPDYEIEYFLADGEYAGTVKRPGDAAGAPLCDAAGAGYGAQTYAIAIDPSCVGNPTSFSYRASTYYDTNPKDENADVAYDRTPNGGFSFPVTRPS